ncbi:MAG: hypothetical protein ABII82_07740 [Verrucomicrobiota bacterium]
MTHPERFSYQLADRHDVREPFRSALVALSLRGEDKDALMVFSPAIDTTAGTTAASVLVVDAEGWHLICEEESGMSTVAASFARSALVEMTIVLLLGRLKIDYVGRNQVRTVVVEFNTVMEPLYHELVQRLLTGMDGGTITAPPEPPDRSADIGLLHSMPLKFRNAVLRFVPPGERILAATYWPAIVLQRNNLIENEISPESALILCEHELMLVSAERLIPEDRATQHYRIGLVNKHGSIAVHGRLSRLHEFRFGGFGHALTLDLLFRIDPAIEILTVAFPESQRAVVVDLMRQALRQKRGG